MILSTLNLNQSTPAESLRPAIKPQVSDAAPDHAIRHSQIHRVVSEIESPDVRDIVGTALAAWLDAEESREDRASAVEALAEYRRDGGIAADEVFALLAAETQATYATDET